ncbi:MAG TPA: hypothetical protein VJK51_02255 [Candidatus Nanoarchaeia archaeon]|nr:hypothetical protein [Candidatus Nanoarchaeia archaeon]
MRFGRSIDSFFRYLSASRIVADHMRQPVYVEGNYIPRVNEERAPLSGEVVNAVVDQVVYEPQFVRLLRDN